MRVYCLDLEGILLPEIWIEVAGRFDLKSLRLTTRDIPDYDKLMRYRLEILRREKIKLADIQRVIRKVKPLPGAAAFLKRLRAQGQAIILSDTFYEFAMPVMKQLDYPALFCNTLKTDKAGFISGYALRQKDGKRKAVKALQSIGFEVRAVGDSYNDLSMLKAADRGVLFNPPESILKTNRSLPVARDYQTLLKLFLAD